MPGARDEDRPVCLKLLLNNDSLPETLDSTRAWTTSKQSRRTGNSNEKTSIAEPLHCVYQ